MKNNKNKEGCNGGWQHENQLPRIKQPPNKPIPDQKKKQSKEQKKSK